MAAKFPASEDIMGQAKQRGSFDVRRQEGIERIKAEKETERLEAERREAAMSPEQKTARRRARMLASSLIAFSGAALKK